MIDGQAGTGATILGLTGVLAGAMQARLGSPPTATFMQKYGVANAAALLWARAAAAPLSVFVMVVLTFHGYLQPELVEIPELEELDISLIARSVVPLVIVGAIATIVQPLEKALQ